MTRIRIVALLSLAIAGPTATAGFYFDKREPTRPCLTAPTGSYRMSTGAADYTVRIDNAARGAALRMQIVDDPTIADFVLVDDGADACSATGVQSVRVDDAAPSPDITIALSRAAAPTKIYVKSAHFSAREAAALFAVAWKTNRQTVAAAR